MEVLRIVYRNLRQQTTEMYKQFWWWQKVDYKCIMYNSPYKKSFDSYYDSLLFDYNIRRISIKITFLHAKNRKTYDYDDETLSKLVRYLTKLYRALKYYNQWYRNHYDYEKCMKEYKHLYLEIPY